MNVCCPLSVKFKPSSSGAAGVEAVTARNPSLLLPGSGSQLHSPSLALTRFSDACWLDTIWKMYRLGLEVPLTIE
jgi:hypothetical protein